MFPTTNDMHLNYNRKYYALEGLHERPQGSHKLEALEERYET